MGDDDKRQAPHQIHDADVGENDRQHPHAEHQHDDRKGAEAKHGAHQPYLLW